jgi:cell division protein FtsZ
VTVIAAGFDGGMPKRRDQSQPALRRDTTPPPLSGQATQRQPESGGGTATATIEAERPAVPVAKEEEPTPAAQPKPPARQPRAIPFDDNEDLDIPDFLK